MSNLKCVVAVFVKALLFVQLVQSQDTAQQIIAGNTNAKAQQVKPYIILFSADGYRHDFMARYDPAFLKKITANGVTASSMKPSFPSLTFPNHYSIITGLYPTHHGIIANDFYDRKTNQFYRSVNKKNPYFYGGIPLWVLAERQKLLTASFYWVGSDCHILGVDPTYYFKFNERIAMARRIAILKEWLELPVDRRPHFISFYFPEVDHAAHKYGTDAAETGLAVQQVDQSIQLITQVCAQFNLPINFIFVSDHGMTNTDTLHKIPFPETIDKIKFIVLPGTSLLRLYARKKVYIGPEYKRLKAVEKDYDVFLSTDMPARWHYSKKDDHYGRIGDIILIPHLPKTFGLTGGTVYGQHGFDNSLTDMQAIFYAWGPAFKTNYQIGEFENIHIYPLIAHILGLKYDHNVDGRFRVLKNILK